MILSTVSNVPSSFSMMLQIFTTLFSFSAFRPVTVGLIRPATLAGDAPKSYLKTGFRLVALLLPRLVIEPLLRAYGLWRPTQFQLRMFHLAKRAVLLVICPVELRLLPR